MGWWAVTAALSVPADPAAARERHRVRSLTQRRAASWLARAHPEEYQACYQQALERLRAQVPGLAAGRARERAARQAHADLHAVFRDEYQARFEEELAALQPDEPVEVGRVERPVAARARLRALLWLADQQPDLTRRRFTAEAARLPPAPGGPGAAAAAGAGLGPCPRRAAGRLPGAVPGALRARAGSGRPAPMTAARMVKRCSGCGPEQPLGEFDRKPRARDGRASHCKACRRVRQRERGHPWARRQAHASGRPAPSCPDSQAKWAHSRAWTRALADLQAAYPEEYVARYQVELAAYRQQHGYEPPSVAGAEQVDGRALVLARARALEALAAEYPEQTDGLTDPVLAGLPADATEGTWAAARLLALDRLRALHPAQFQARYAAELARHASKADQEPPP